MKLFGIKICQMSPEVVVSRAVKALEFQVILTSHAAKQSRLDSDRRREGFLLARDM